ARGQRRSASRYASWLAPLGDRVDRGRRGRPLLGLEPVDDSESLVAGMAALIALAIEIDVAAIDDVAAACAGAIFGSRPRVVTKRGQCRDRRALHGDERRVVLEFGELPCKRLPVT